MTATAELRKSLEVAPPSSTVDWLNMLIYGDPGAGKTYLGGTAEDSKLTSPVLFLDVEGGVTTIRKRTGIDVVPIRSVKDIDEKYNTIYKSIDPKTGLIYYKTIVVDSLTELADVDMRFIMKLAYDRNPDKVDKDVPSPREWGKVRNHMRTIVRAFRDLPCNVIFTAHAGQQQDEGQPTQRFPGFSGKLRTEIPGFMDIVGYMYTDTQGGDITRKIQFTGTRRVVAKDRTASLGDFLENTSIPEMWDLIHDTQASKG